VSVRASYADWADYNRRFTETVRRMDPADVAIRVPGSEDWPIWAVVGHMAGMRVYWLCVVAGEAGADSTPFPDAGGPGWEDDLERPRTVDELVGALEATWQVIDATLERWTPPMLSETVERDGSRGRQRHARQSILLRLLYHEAYHAGEINVALKANGRELFDPWPHADWTIDPSGRGS
jgi:uncharacterized damage-inducible protein DinB